MRLARPSTSIVVLLLTIALAGIAGIQALSWREVRRLADETFRANVHAALADVVERLETAELERRVVELQLLASDAAVVPLALALPGGAGTGAPGGAALVAGPGRFHLPVTSTRRTLILDLPQPQRIHLARVSAPPQEVFAEDRPAGRHELPPLECPDQQPCEYRLDVGALPHRVFVAGGRIVRIALAAPRSSQLLALVHKAIEQSMTGGAPPIQLRIDPGTLEATLRASLVERGVVAPLSFGIVSGGRVVMAGPNAVRAELERTPFHARLFPHDVRPGTDEVAVVFPGGGPAHGTPVVTWAIVSGLLIAVTVGCFATVLHLAAAQRRFASRLTDFVNNLAHEFKTPLSTIGLAGDAMAEAAGREDATGVAKFRRVIADECRRLRIQVERVLEVAAFERRERAGLSLAPVDLHDVVRTAIDHFEPRVAARHGRIEASLNADRHHVVGDEVHLLGVLHNLLDNALKYTPQTPVIRIATASAAGRVRLAVADSGTGIPTGEERRIFEPFYRAPQGTARHEPGFGIGLSYVARVVEAHGGSVAARNAPAGGAIVEIALPVGSPTSEEPTTDDDTR